MNICKLSKLKCKGVRCEISSLWAEPLLRGSSMPGPLWEIVSAVCTQKQQQDSSQPSRALTQLLAFLQQCSKPGHSTLRCCQSLSRWWRLCHVAGYALSVVNCPSCWMRAQWPHALFPGSFSACSLCTLHHIGHLNTHLQNCLLSLIFLWLQLPTDADLSLCSSLAVLS